MSAIVEQMRIEIGVLTKERDEQRQAADYWMTEACRDHNALQKLTEERDKMKAAAKLALDALDEAQQYVYYEGNYLHSVSQAITALQQAGVK